MLCLDLPSSDLYIQPSEELFQEEIPSLFIQAFNITFQGSYELLSTEMVTMLANDSIILNNTLLRAQRLWVQADGNIELYTTIIVNESVLDTDCNCYQEGGTCTPWNFAYPQLFPNPNSIEFELENFTSLLSPEDVPLNTVTFTSMQNLTMIGSEFYFSVIGMFAQTIHL